MKSFAISLLCSIAAFGCLPEEKEEEGTALGGFLSYATDLKIPEDAKLLKYDSTQKFWTALTIEGIEDNKAVDTSSAEPSDEEKEAEEADECSAERGNQKVEASGESVKIAFTLDQTACENANRKKNPSQDESKVNKDNVKFFLQMTCKGKDLSSLNGLPVSDLEDDPCEGATAAEILMHSKYEADTEGTYESAAGSTTYQNATTTITAEMKEDGTPCRWVKDGEAMKVEAGCTYITLTVNEKIRTNGEASDEEGLTQYVKKTYKDIAKVKNGDDERYASGALDVVLGDWTGSVTYTSADMPPAVSFSNGTLDYEGTLGDSYYEGSELTKQPATNASPFAELRKHLNVLDMQKQRQKTGASLR